MIRCDDPSVDLLRLQFKRLTLSPTRYRGGGELIYLILSISIRRVDLFDFIYFDFDLLILILILIPLSKFVATLATTGYSL